MLPMAGCPGGVTVHTLPQLAAWAKAFDAAKHAAKRGSARATAPAAVRRFGPRSSLEAPPLRRTTLRICFTA
jgi:hypothetical protein